MDKGVFQTKTVPPETNLRFHRKRQGRLRVWKRGSDWTYPFKLKSGPAVASPLDLLRLICWFVSGWY